MYEKMMVTFEEWFNIERSLAKLTELDETGVFLRSVLCMTADYVAVKSGTTTRELLEELLPTIDEVNATEGVMVC